MQVFYLLKAILKETRKYTGKKQQGWPKEENDIDLRQIRDIRILYFGREMQKDVYDMEKLHWE